MLTALPYHTHPVRRKIPNNFGLYDMIGNLSEALGA